MITSSAVGFLEGRGLWEGVVIRGGLWHRRKRSLAHLFATLWSDSESGRGATSSGLLPRSIRDTASVSLAWTPKARFGGHLFLEAVCERY